MQIEVIMPKMGESIQEGTILRWWKKEGESIEKDETILEISTDKVDSEIPSPVTGILEKIIADEQETVPVGNVIAYIETEEVVEEKNTNASETNSLSHSLNSKLKQFQRQAFAAVDKYRQKDARFYSPLVKAIAKKEGINKIDLDTIAGSGSGGRVTKNDILDYIEHRTNGKFVLNRGISDMNNSPIDITELTKKYPAPEFQIIRMDNTQKKMAERMVRSTVTSPQVTIVDEVDMTSIVKNRLRILELSEKQESFKLTYTHFFAFAVIDILKEFPIINSAIEGDAIIKKNFINLGIAVATENGLVVPVIKNAEKLRFNELARALNDAADRARTKKLMPEETVNGTFSITNYGVFGSIIGTPIINQPQIAILGIGAIKKRPVVIEDDNDHPSIAIRSMVYLTLTFDHRIIDGATGGKFLSRVKWCLENFNFKLIDNDIIN